MRVAMQAGVPLGYTQEFEGYLVKQPISTVTSPACDSSLGGNLLTDVGVRPIGRPASSRWVGSTPAKRPLEISTKVIRPKVPNPNGETVNLVTCDNLPPILAISQFYALLGVCPEDTNRLRGMALTTHRVPDTIQGKTVERRSLAARAKDIAGSSVAFDICSNGWIRPMGSQVYIELVVNDKVSPPILKLLVHERLPKGVLVIQRVTNQNYRKISGTSVHMVEIGEVD